MKKKGIITVVALVVVVAAMLLVYGLFREKPVEGGKTITIEVVNSAGESKLYELRTDAQFLRQALEETEGLEIVGHEGPYGLTVEAVNGERAVFEEDGAYWGFYVNGDYCNYGPEEQPVEDGDAFQIAYTR